MTRAPIVVAAVLALLAARDAARRRAHRPARGFHRPRLEDSSRTPILKKEAEDGGARKRIREVVNQIFDFTAISQRCLGRHWQARTPPSGAVRPRSSATSSRTRTSRRSRAIPGEDQYPGDTIEGELAIVKTRIVTKQETEIPVDYRMF